jgi:hypothetical protein
MSGGGSAEAINKTARDDSGDEGETVTDASGTGKNRGATKFGLATLCLTTLSTSDTQHDNNKWDISLTALGIQCHYAVSTFFTMLTIAPSQSGSEPLSCHFHPSLIFEGKESTQLAEN